MGALNKLKHKAEELADKAEDKAEELADKVEDRLQDPDTTADAVEDVPPWRKDHGS